MAAGEQTGLNALSSAAYNPNRTGLIDQTLQGKFLPGQSGANPYFDAAVRNAQRPTLQGLTDTLTRALPGRFTQAGQFTQPHGSSAFDNAAALATRGAADAMGGIATNMGNQQYQQERQLQQQAINLSQQDISSMVTNLQSQGLPRLIEDMGVQRALQEFQTRMSSLMQALGIAAGSPISQVAQTVQSSGETQGGIIPGIAGTMLLPKSTMNG